MGDEVFETGIREPSCIHSEPPFYQPMSWCVECRHHPRLAAWREYWAARGR